MKRKKWKFIVFALLLVMLVAGTMQLTVSAKSINPDDVNIDYVNETITVKTTEDKVIYFSEVYNKDLSRWDICEVRNGRAAFDISWVNSNKTVRLYLCGDKNTDVVSVDITWEEDFNVEFTGTLLTTDITEAETWKQVYKKYPNFSEDTGYFIFTIEENGRDMSYFNVENIQWRKGDDGVWRDYKELDLKEMNIRGINLEFRVVANNTDKYRASSTAKISVSKLLSAPAILVNPNTMTVGIKNGMEFSFDKEEWIMIPEYNKKFGTEEYLIEESVRENAIEEIYTSERMSAVLMQVILKTQAPGFTMNTPMSKEKLTNTFGDLFDFTEEGIVLYVREIGTARKAASKIAEVVIPYAPDGMAEAVEGELVFSYGESKTNTGGIVVENKSDYRYQVGVITPEDEEYAKLGTAEENNIDISTMKWTSIKNGKMVKISNKKVPEGSYLIYRIAGEDKHLPSTYLVYGPMEYDHLTYAGIASAKKMAGETLEAVVSTNFEKKPDGTYDGLTFQWQVCDNVKVEAPVWTDIENATGAAFTLTNDQADKYVRVKITDEHNNTLYSDEEGPIKYVEPSEEETPEGGEGGETLTPSPTAAP